MRASWLVSSAVLWVRVRAEGGHSLAAGGAGSRLRRFGRDEEGITTVVFALLFTAVLMAAAVAVDHGRIVTEISRDQRALDAAVLAASDQLGTDNQDVTGKAMAEAFYTANRGASAPSKIYAIAFDADNGEISASTKTDWKAKLMAGLDHMFPGIGDDRQLSVNSKVAKGNGSVEVALVLDNSGSMGGSYISDLRTAAADLANVVFAGAEGSDRVMVGIVPFAASVNIGSANSNANWIDGAGQSSIHYENFSENRTRFQLFSDVGTSWAGCVEARPNGHDVTDALPTSNNGDTLFVPMFAPDEPGEAGSNSLGYGNSYLDDDGGQCEPYERVCESYSRRGNCRRWSTVSLPPAEAQARTCKYAGETPQGASGPNYMCTTQAVLPLNSTKSSVVNAINAMQASGNTNIKEGVAWGWRVLSPSAPYDQGREYSDGENRKIMIVMTDGENYYNDENNHNLSIYASQGYAAKGRMGVTHTRTGYTNHLNSKTLEACANAKAAGITVYTVAFRLEGDANTTALLRSCASGPDNAFIASNGSTLIQSFRNIGKEISAVRVAG